MHRNCWGGVAIGAFSRELHACGGACSPPTSGAVLILRGFPMRRVYKFVVVVFLLTGFLGGQGYGQGGATGAISGVVVDSSGASIADAEVQITASRTETLARKITAGADGSFTVTLLPPGTYYLL